MKKFLSFSFYTSLLYLFLNTMSVNAASFMEQLVQPQLKVVEYNEKLESVRAGLLDGVSIFMDPVLYTKWSNMLVSIGVIVLLLVLIKIGTSILTGSKDNLLKFFAYLVLLFFIASIYAPFFSKLGEFMSGDERRYIDSETGKSYSRVYLPANTAISVNPYYLTKDGTQKVMSEDSNLLLKRDDTSMFGWEYLGIPAKVAQTQWQSSTDPTNRYSKAFYGVNLDVLFKGKDLNTYVPELAVGRLGIEKSDSTCSVHIEPESYNTKGKNSLMSLVEAIGRTSWIDEAKSIKSGNKGGITPLKGLTYKYVVGTPSFKEDTQQVVVSYPCDKFPLGVYLLSDEYISEFGGFYGEPYKNMPDYGTLQTTLGRAPTIRETIVSELSSQPSQGIYTHTLEKILSESSYIDQKKLLYTYYAYITLYGITQQNISAEIKNGSDRIKQAISSCSRIIMGTVQNTDDFKKCLVIDQIGDTTMYTQDTSKKVGLLGKNKEISAGYVIPTPTSIDWDRSNLSLTYGDLSSLLDHPIQAATTVVKDAVKKSTCFWCSESEPVTTNLSTESDISDEQRLTDAGLDLDSLKGVSSEDKSKVVAWITQQGYLKNPWVWFNGTHEPILSSINSYDLNGDGIVDYSQKNVNYTKDKTLYAYSFGKTLPTLDKDIINYIQKPIYNSIPIATENEYRLFISDKDQKSQFLKASEVTTKPVTSYIINKVPGFFVPDTISIDMNPQDIEHERVLGSTTANIIYIAPTTINIPTVQSSGLGTTSESTIPISTESTNNDNVVLGKTTMDGFSTNGKPTIQIKGSDLYIGSSTTSYKDITPQNDQGSKFELSFIEKYKYGFFPFRKQLSAVTGFIGDSKEQKDYSSLYTWKLVGQSVTKNEIGLSTKEIFISKNDGKGTYYVYSGLEDMTIQSGSGSLQTKITYNGKSIPDYISSLGSNYIVKDIYSLSGPGIYEGNAIAKTLKYVEEQSVLTYDWKNSFSDKIKELYLDSNSTLGDTGTYIYYYRDLYTGQNIQFEITHPRVISTVYVGSNETLLSINSVVGGIPIVKGADIQRDSVNGQLGLSKKADIQKIDYTKLGRSFHTSDIGLSIPARILVNSNLNIPITYSTPNENYYSEYKKSGNVCVINITATESSSDLFDKYPKDGVDLNKCSTVGDQMRLTDIRLQTFKQQASLLAGTTKDMFTHISIPLLNNNYIPYFTGDRRDQNYAGEVTYTDTLFNNTKISGIKVQEGDVVILKPGVLVGNYSQPFTLLVPTEIVPYLDYVRLDSPSEKVVPSKVYTGGIYDWLTSVTRFIKDGKIIQTIAGNSVVLSDTEKYTNFALEKYDSRPQALKYIEGSVPDKYFHAYYGESYFNDQEAIKNLTGMMPEISGMAFSLMGGVLSFRTWALSWIYIFSPLFTFGLLFPSTRKFFTIPVGVTIGLLILPIIVLFCINLLLI